jgi:formate dehydrogenase major subunit
VTPFEPPVDELTEEFPLRLTTGRRLDSYNTGVQTGGYTSPLRRGETIDVSPEDAARLGLDEGEVVRSDLSAWLAQRPRTGRSGVCVRGSCS